MRQIAFYGKGGIVKSTVAQNVAATLAAQGHRVLLVGCDPKHDSSRPFLAGRSPATIVSLLSRGLREPAPEDYLMKVGDRLHCIEVGGPEPGVGCAGRGILRMFELVDEARLLTPENYDVVLYDVLGDVVCGGFAAPMRTGHADEIVVVLAGEFMALYAANNICRGVANYAAHRPIRLAGFVLNRRQVAAEAEVVAAFCGRLGGRLLADLPRSPVVPVAEAARRTVVEFKPESAEAQRFRELGRILCSPPAAGTVPTPLSDESLEQLYFERAAQIQ